VHFTRDRAKMGELSSPPWLTTTAWTMAALIVVLNIKLVYDSARTLLL
jgi:manganese transport protein